VFTSLRIPFWNTDALRAAMALWHDTQHGIPRFDVERLLAWHIGIDALLFVPTYCVLLWWLLRRVGASKRVARSTATATAVVDWLETGVTGYFFIVRHLEPSSAIWILQALTFLKWVAIVWSLATIVVLWNQRRRKDSSARSPLLLLRGHEGLTSVTVIVVVFAGAVALPAGGPLDQIPDVLRAQFAPSVSWATRVLSVVALALLAASVATGAALAADPWASGAPAKLVRNRTVLFVAGAISATLLLVGFVLEDQWHVEALAPVLVIAAIWAAAKLATIAGASEHGRKPHDAWATPIDADAAARYAGALAGAIVFAGGIGLLRAAFPAWVLGLRAGVLPWWLVSLGAAAVVLAGGLVTQRIVLPALGPVIAPDKQAVDRGRRRRRAFGAATVSATLGFAAWLTVDPDHAGLVGTTGVIAIGFGAFALGAGWLAWVAQERIAWEATQTLGIGIRTPWLAIVAAVWLVSSLLNTDGVYHDARVVSTPNPLAPRYANLDSAFVAWRNAQSGPACGSGSGDLPLVLVAAPGGGIRAAYWTASALDSLFSGRGAACATSPIFAMSGVSGGSLGLTTWVAASAAGSDGRSSVAGMADDRALASAAAGLFFRDALQPLVPVATRWRDRAALLEDGWERAEHSPLGSLKWNDLGNGISWVPVIVLNGSSVNDGCRVLVANVGGLPAEVKHGCSETPDIGVASGPVTSAIDGIATLRARTDSLCDTGVQLRAATAALLSARFPVVSPSGALVQCPLGGSLARAAAESLRTQTYVVDGGYFENSGILTLLQLWRAVEPLVRRENAAPGARRIVPWLVVIDNHYRSAASAAAPRRPLELVVPLKTLTSGNVASQAALEQMAWGEIAGNGDRCASGGSATSTAGAPPQAPQGCVVVVAPMVSPGVSAPLGWVLSDMSRANMDEQIKQRFVRTGSRADARLVTLLGLIGRPAAPMQSDSRR
jgi:hypothetical protein